MTEIESRSSITPEGRPGPVGRMAAPLDDVDRRLLQELQRDGRLSVRELAERATVSRATAYARLDRLVSSGVIRGFTAVVDPVSLGLGLSAYVHVKIAQHSWRDIKDALSRLEHVQHVAFVSGSFDLILLVRARDLAELRDVVLERLHGMPGIESTQTSFLLDEAGWIPPAPAA
jgi:DNA-binding Lrp family transcriptional regulator